MKTITIKTPLIENNGIVSDTIPHLLEHITTSNFTITPKNYFSYLVDATASTFPGYTVIQIPDEINEYEIIAIITSPISRELFERERNTYQEEIKEIRNEYIHKLHNKIAKKLYNNKHIYTKKPTYKTLIQYHQKRYTRESLIISDKDDRILFMGNHIKKIISTDNFLFSQPEFYKHKIGNLQLCIYTFPLSSRENHRVAYFLYDLIKNYITFQERYMQGIYYYTSVEYFHTKEHIVLAYPLGTDINITSDFFNAYKKYYLDNIEKKYDTYWRVIDCIHGFGYTDITKAKQFINTICFEQVNDIIKKSNTEICTTPQ